MQKIIIIGASSGIGEQLAYIYAGKNSKVAVTGRRKNLLENIQKQFPDNIIVNDFDITNTNNTEKLLEIVNTLGGLDILIISAGYGDLNEKLDFITEKNTIDVNIVAFTEIADWGFNYFKNQGYGQIVGITSIGGLRGNFIAPAYNASKAYQINYLEGLRQKAAKNKLNITITDIRPGFVDTAMAKGEKKFWMADAKKAANQIFNAIKNKKDKKYITKRWVVFATIMKILPTKIYKRL